MGKGNKRKGKKGKKKKGKKIRTNFNKKEFCEIFCQTCLICKDPEPTFCYLDMYKHEPRPFTQVFNNLIEIHAIYQSMGRSIRSLSVEQFQNVVCRTGICFNGDSYASAGCDSTKDCYKKFMTQLGATNTSIIHEGAGELIEFKNNKSKKSLLSYRKKKRKKAKARVVFVSYPTFFSSQNATFQAAIRKIIYGDNDNQQNKDQELSASDSRAASGDTKG